MGFNGKLTQQQYDTLRLIERSPDIGDGWRQSAPEIFKQLLLPMPRELVDVRVTDRMVKLTDEAEAILAWL